MVAGIRFNWDLRQLSGLIHGVTWWLVGRGGRTGPQTHAPPRRARQFPWTQTEWKTNKNRTYNETCCKLFVTRPIILDKGNYSAQTEIYVAERHAAGAFIFRIKYAKCHREKYVPIATDSNSNSVGPCSDTFTTRAYLRTNTNLNDLL